MIIIKNSFDSMFWGEYTQEILGNKKFSTNSCRIEKSYNQDKKTLILEF